MAGNEERLAEQQGRLRQSLLDVEGHLAQETSRKGSRDRLASFQRARDEALLYNAGLTGQDAVVNRQTTRRAATAALALFGLDATAQTVPQLHGPHFGAAEIEQLRIDCYELLLTLAEAVAQPGTASEEPRAKARQALALLQQADQLLGRPTRTNQLQKARCLTQLGDAAGAVAEGRRADDAGLQPTTASDFFLLGTLLLGGERGNQPGDVLQAVRYFRSAVRDQPKHFWAHYFLAVAQLRAQPPQPHGAIDSLSTCAALSPDREWIYVLKGYAHALVNEFDAAEAEFQRAERLPLSDAARYILLVNRGAACFRWGRLMEARSDLEQAIALKPQEFMAHVNLAQACQQEYRLLTVSAVGRACFSADALPAVTQLAAAVQARFDEALQHFGLRHRAPAATGAIVRQPVHLYLDHRDLAAALRDFEAAIRLEHDSRRAQADYWTEKGRILHALKNGQPRSGVTDMPWRPFRTTPRRTVSRRSSIWKRPIIRRRKLRSRPICRPASPRPKSTRHAA